MENTSESIKHQVIAALMHDEAEDGLYFRNFFLLHEEDERKAVVATQEQLLDALKELVAEGKVSIDENEEELIFRLKAEE